MELEEAIEILNNYLCETHRKFCSIGAVGIPNKEYFAVETLLNHVTKQEKMIDKMADEILELNTMIVEKEELFSVVPMWLGKEHIIEYFKGITNKKD